MLAAANEMYDFMASAALDFFGTEGFVDGQVFISTVVAVSGPPKNPSLPFIINKTYVSVFERPLIVFSHLNVTSHLLPSTYRYAPLNWLRLKASKLISLISITTVKSSGDDVTEKSTQVCPVKDTRYELPGLIA